LLSSDTTSRDQLATTVAATLLFAFTANWIHIALPLVPFHSDATDTLAVHENGSAAVASPLRTFPVPVHPDGSPVHTSAVR
jgi:hypothetical protein